MYAGPVICSHVNTYQFKAYGIDENGYEWMRTDRVKCVQCRRAHVHAHTLN